MKHKKFLFLGFFLFIVFFIFFLFKISFGSDLLKIYFQNQIDKYFPHMKVETLVFNFNNFSMDLKEGKNVYKVYGQIFPLDAIIEGNIKEFNINNKIFKENATLSGGIAKKKNSYVINSNVYFDDNIGFLKIILNQNKLIKFKTDNVDVNYLLNKLHFPILQNLNAKVSLNLVKKNLNYIINAKIKGTYKNKDINSSIDFYFNSLKNIVINGKADSKVLQGVFKAKINNNQIFYNGDFNKFDLSLLDLIYPFRGIVELKIKNEDKDIIKFFSKDFQGFKDNKALNINFNMPVSLFFKYINLFNVFKSGDVIGRIVIKKNGSFNFIIQNAILRKEFAEKLHLKNRFFKKIFIKGVFDKNHIIFDLLADNKNYLINIKQGKIFLKRSPDYIFKIIVDNFKNKIYYKFKDRKLKLIKKEKLKNKNNQILVF
jgi:hypothetical protein